MGVVESRDEIRQPSQEPRVLGSTNHVRFPRGRRVERVLTLLRSFIAATQSLCLRPRLRRCHRICRLVLREYIYFRIFVAILMSPLELRTTQPTGSLFSGGVFGSQQSQPAQGSSLFGGSAFGQAGQQQQQPQQQTGGLFGNAQPQQQQQQAPQTGSLFASLGQNQNQNQNQPTQQTSGGLFGQTQQQPQQQQPTGSLFGGASTQTGGGLFGGLIHI